MQQEFRKESFAVYYSFARRFLIEMISYYHSHARVVVFDILFLSKLFVASDGWMDVATDEKLLGVETFSLELILTSVINF